MPPTAERGCLVIADISGYTDYVVTSPLEYAEDVVADVTAGVVERLEPILRVNKLEGDAAFGYALEEELDASMLLDTIEECYFGFRRRLRGIEHSTSCTCNACARRPSKPTEISHAWSPAGAQRADGAWAGSPQDLGSTGGSRLATSGLPSSCRPRSLRSGGCP